MHDRLKNDGYKKTQGTTKTCDENKTFTHFLSYLKTRHRTERNGNNWERHMSFSGNIHAIAAADDDEIKLYF